MWYDTIVWMEMSYDTMTYDGQEVKYIIGLLFPSSTHTNYTSLLGVDSMVAVGAKCLANIEF